MFVLCENRNHMIGSQFCDRMQTQNNTHNYLKSRAITRGIPRYGKGHIVKKYCDAGTNFNLEIEPHSETVDIFK